MKEYMLMVLVPIVAAIIGAVFLPVLEAVKRSRQPTYDDKQSVLGRYNCQWFADTGSGETIYANDVVDICTIKGSRLTANGRDQRFHYTLEGNISRGGVLAFYYVIIEKPMSLTGSLTLVMNPLGAALEGRWSGYVSEGKLLNGRVVWQRIPDVETKK